MKWLLIFLVYVYRKLFPRKWKGECLFKVSCSEFVLRVSMSHGFVRGLGALRQRIRRCRGGYRICSSKIACGLELHLCDGSVIGESEISNHLLEPYWDAQTRLEAILKQQPDSRAKQAVCH